MFYTVEAALGTLGVSLVNDILDLSRRDSRHTEISLALMNCHELLHEVGEAFRIGSPKPELDIRDATGDIPLLMTDSLRLRHIVFNLVSNSVKFTERGYVELRARFDRVDATGDMGTLVIEVEDTGCGIAPDMLSRIFDPFVQAQDPRHSADRAGGTGLWLSICRRLVEAMGGEAMSKLNAALETGQAYDFVFTDLWMPNENGIEFVERLRGDSRFRSLPVYAVTADAEFPHDDRSKLFTGILLKPLTYGKLMEVFANAASRHN